MDIFQLLDQKFDIKEKVYNLSKLLNDGRYFDDGYYGYCSFEEFFGENYFRGWPLSCGFASSNDFRKGLGINYLQRNGEEYFYPSNEKEAIIYLQYSVNIVSYLRYLDKTTNICLKTDFFSHFDKMFEYILDKYNHQVVFDETKKYYLIVPKNEKTINAVSAITEKDISLLLLEYTSVLNKNNIVRKREILKLVANFMEQIIDVNLKKYSSGPVHDIYDKLSSILNNFNIRHNNTDTSKKGYYKEGLKLFSECDYEELYDCAYDLILDAIILNKLNDNIEVYEKFKNKAGF